MTSYLSPGLNTLVLTTSGNGDCLSLVVAAIDLPAGAAAPGKKKKKEKREKGSNFQYPQSCEQRKFDPHRPHRVWML
ncbi:MAG: hypothetical protein HY752_04575 [Nitrospirae bacterium]|nr:hypothetical protein [Nitrospirota bacterium]